MGDGLAKLKVAAMRSASQLCYSWPAWRVSVKVTARLGTFPASTN